MRARSAHPDAASSGTSPVLLPFILKFSVSNATFLVTIGAGPPSAETMGEIMLAGPNQPQNDIAPGFTGLIRLGFQDHSES